MLLYDQIGELARAHVEAVRGGRPALFDGIATRISQGDESVVTDEIGEVETRHPLDGG